MSTEPPPIIVVGPGDSAAPAPPADRPRLGRVAALVVVAALAQVSVLVYMRLADGTPDVLAAVVVCVALMRGRLAGAVAGFAGGLLMELTSPVDTLGAYALLYLVVGWFCGRYCEAPESHGVLPGVVMTAGAAVAVQVGYAALQVADGRTLLAAEFVQRVLMPTLALTVLLYPLVALAARRLLDAPRNYEPGLRL
ncbi:MAG: rod shape-determining protein MreD [Thermoleophilia bacterium]|nr:rod shape-determining protein MreD [Thermoleophilia bacterium]